MKLSRTINFCYTLRVKLKVSKSVPEARPIWIQTVLLNNFSVWWSLIIRNIKKSDMVQRMAPMLKNLRTKKMGYLRIIWNLLIWINVDKMRCFMLKSRLSQENRPNEDCVLGDRTRAETINFFSPSWPQVL